MNSSLLKKALPHLLAIILFIVVAVIFNKPTLEGKSLNQSDKVGWKGSAKQSEDYRAKYGHYPLWTNSIFSGMPAYTIDLQGKYRITDFYNTSYHVLNLWLPNPINYFFVACICFYLLAMVFGLNWWIAVLGAVGFAYCTFNPILVAAGHETELFALAVMPAVIAGVLLILKRKYWSGLAVLTFFFSMQVLIQHLQIIYYTGLSIVLILAIWFITHVKEKQVKHFIISGLLVALSLTVGFLDFAYTMLPVKEYAAETMRGGRSELTQADAKNKTKGGLDKEYAFQWSYGIGETLTLFIPGMKGGGNAGKLITGDSKFAERLAELGVPEDNGISMANSFAYWGDQPFTAGPVYLGAVICFLFILGLVYVKSWHKWWLLAVAILGILLAWGRNFAAFNYFLFDYLPFYNKFRAPAMSLVLPQLALALLGCLGLQQLVSEKTGTEESWKKFRTVLVGTGVLVALSLIIYVMSDFKSAGDAQTRERFAAQLTQGKQMTPEMQQQMNPVLNGLMTGLQEDRKAIFSADLLRSVVLVLLATGFCWFYIRGKIRPVVLMAGLLVLSSFDLLAESYKYLNEDNYIEAAAVEEEFSPSSADEKINSDLAKPFRVLDQSGGDPFTNGHTSYAHNSIGGYSPAKLALYNDLIERQLRKGNQQVYDMLNTRYIITRPQNGQGEDVAVPNAGAFGACWLVSGIKYVNNADEEMSALDADSTRLRDTVVINRKFTSSVLFPPQADSSATVGIREYNNDKIVYRFQARTNQFVVFSEIYYPFGWNVFIDGKPATYLRVNYALRGMSVPAGKHDIEFRFEPKSYTMGNNISLFSIIISIGLILFSLYDAFKKWKSNQTQPVKS